MQLKNIISIILIGLFLIPNCFAPSGDDDFFADDEEITEENLADQLANNPEDAIDFLRSNRDLFSGLDPSVISGFEPGIIDEFSDMITPTQATGIPKEKIAKLSSDTIKTILKDLNPNQLDSITEEQAQTLTQEKLDYVIDQLAGDELNDFIDKLSLDQVNTYVQNNPNLDDLPDEMFDRYIHENINPDMDIFTEDGMIDGTEFTNNDITIDLADFSEGGWDIESTENGFNINSNSDDNRMSVTNPLTGDKIETTLDIGESITIEYTLGQEFMIKLNDQFLNLDVLPEGPGRLRLYSKTKGTTLRINTAGEYRFNDGILTYTNQDYTESIDSDAEALADIDIAVGVVCMKLSSGAKYSFEKGNYSFSNKIKTDDYKLCIKKSDYIKDEYFKTIQKYEQLSGNHKFGYVNTIIDYCYYGSLIDYFYSEYDTYESNDVYDTTIDKTSVLINSESPNKITNTRYFSIFENNNRYLKISPELLSTKEITQYKTLHDSEITIDDQKLVQTTSTNSVTAFVIGSNAAEEYVNRIV